MSFDSSRVRFVLVEPLAGGNVGSVARALKNLGFTRLDLVRPQCDPRGPEARMMAVDADDLLSRARTHDRLDAALAGAATVAGTSRRKGRYRRPHRRLDQVTEELVRLTVAGDLAVVFGREDHGLSDVELDRCTHLVHLPGSADYPSFNLAQAVLLVAYELRRVALAGTPDDGPGAVATHEEREAMYGHLRRALLTIGFLQQDTAESMMRRLRRLFGRAALSSEEVKILHGISRQSLWAARQAGIPIVDRPADAEDDGP